MTIEIIFILIFLPDSLGLPYTTLHRDQRTNKDCSEERSHETQAAFNVNIEYSRLLSYHYFQSCSQSESREVFGTISEMADPGDIGSHLCSVLTKVRTTCAEDLRTCFTEEDQHQMIGAEVGQLRTFFVRMTRGKIEQEDIEEDRCGQASDVSKDRQRPVYSTLYDFTDNTITDKKEQNKLISVLYNFKDLAEDARQLVAKTEELAEMTGTLLNNTLKIMDDTRKDLDHQVEVYPYPIAISKKGHQTKKKLKNLIRHKHRKLENRKPGKAQNQKYKDDQATTTVCQEEEIPGGKSKLEV